VRALLGWSAPGLAGRIHAGAAPLNNLAATEFVLFTSYISYGLVLPISPFFLLLLEEFELQLQHFTPHSILQAAIFVHLYEMFVGVALCTFLFRHFFVLVKFGKTRDHIGAYYFQTRPDLAVVYIPTLGGARWENLRSDWVIASVEANERLVLPSNGSALDRKLWRTKSSLAPEFLPVLDRIQALATGGLMLMHVVGDLLKRRIASLQRRSRLCCWFTGLNDIGRIQRGPGTDLSWDELEVLVGGISGETFIPESLILPQGIPALCDDLGLRTAIWPRCRPSTRAAWWFTRPAAETPSAGSGSPMHRLEVPSPPVRPTVPLPLWPPCPWTRARGLQAVPPPVPPPQVAPGGQRRRGDTDCAALMDRSLRSLPRSARGP
jgi:hypothetical protein